MASQDSKERQSMILVTFTTRREPCAYPVFILHTRKQTSKIKRLSKISQPRNDGRILGQGAGYAGLFCTSFPSLWLWLQHFWKAVSWAETEVFLGATWSVVGPRIVFPSGSAWLLCLAGSYMSQCVAGGYRSHLHRALEILSIEVTKV